MVASASAPSRQSDLQADRGPLRPARDAPQAVAASGHRPVLDRLEDWLAGYPDTIPVRLVHRAPMLLWRLGLGRYEGDVVLTTTGRKSGLPRRIVIGGGRMAGRMYLWNPYGEQAHWYRNLEADPVVTIQDAGGAWTARAVHPSDHGEAVALYAHLDRGVGRRFHLYLADLAVEDSAEGFARDIERIHLVRLDPVDEAGPAPQPADLAWVWPVAGAAGLVGLLTRLRPRVAVAGAATTLASLLVLRGRAILERLTDLVISNPSGPISRFLYRDATAMHGVGWRYCHERLGLRADDRLLDVGCGGGTFLSQALETVGSAAGLDHSPDMVALTRENNAQAVAAGRLEVRLGDAASLPWEEASFDAVSNLAAFMLAEDPEAIVREAARVLRPGGRFVVVTMAAPGDDLGSRVTRWLMPKARFFSDEELSHMLEEAGFELVQASSPDGELQVGYGVRSGAKR